MRVGITSPYAWDIPGGVQAHIKDLARALTARGHSVSVLTPATAEAQLEEYVHSSGRPVPIPYNGSVARIGFGPVTAWRVRQWLRHGNFDVVHVHEPTTASISFLACLFSRVPVVATHHAAARRSRILAAAHHSVQPVMEALAARIVVSPLARRFQVEHLDGGGVEIPNGVSVNTFRHAQPLDLHTEQQETLGFLGRVTEPRKGFRVLLDAFTQLAAERSKLHLVVVGPCERDAVLAHLPAQYAERVMTFGRVSDAVKARVLRSVDVFVAPNTRGESFGITLAEAMAARTPVIASDLDAFRYVLRHGEAGVLFPPRDSRALTQSIRRVLDDAALRAQLIERADAVVAEYDWSVVAEKIVDVYHSVLAATRLQRSL